LFAYMSIALAFLLQLVAGVPLISIVTGAVIVALPLWLLYFVSKERWMGFGDVLIALVMGALLGYSSGLTALMVAFWVGAVYGIGVMLVGKIKHRNTLKMSSQVPFGPFLIIATFIVYIFGWTLPSLLSWFVW
ncbi:MAG: prepilin peptidase, partial [Minisyncoccia bacterium]